jgi:ribonuclease D
MHRAREPKTPDTEELSMSNVSVVDKCCDAETLYTLQTAFRDVKLVALDCEGVDLMRSPGKVTIVQLATESHCFLLDMLDRDKHDPLVGWLRRLLEDESVEKIIHDCRMDADALKHNLNINLVNVHDTSCWEHVATGIESQPLNAVLQAHRLASNVVRDGSVYQTNHAFWAVRPLTEQMIKWASGDLASLFDLRKQQIIQVHDTIKSRLAREESKKFLDAGRMCMQTVTRVPSHKIGRFIGTRGANIRTLQKRTGTLIYSRGARQDNNFAVFYRDKHGLAAVIRAIDEL